MKTIKLLSTLILFVTQVNAQTLVMETGVVDINHRITHIDFNNTFVDPVVIANLPSFNGGHEAVVRVDNVTGTGFDLELQEPISRNDRHTFETVHYIVIEKGNYTFDDGTMLEAGTISASHLSFQTVSLLQTYDATPAIMTQIQTDNSLTNFLKTRQQNSSTTDFEVKIEREESLNTTDFGGTEEIGYFAISKGTGVLDGVIFEAESFDADSDITTYTFTETFAAGNHFIGSIATFNEADPVGLRLEDLTAAEVEIALEEDFSDDGEESHATETVDYFNIDDNGGAGIYLPFLLPIELVSFTVELRNNNTVGLNWVTASEINNDYFLVQRSVDGANWESIGRVEGAGNSAMELHYSFTDEQPYAAVSYYRIKQIDFDGQFSYSPVETVRSEKMASASIKAYPVPAQDVITIEGDESELKAFRIYNSMGQDVTPQIDVLINDATQKKLNISQLPTGIYFVKTKNATTRINRI